MEGTRETWIRIAGGIALAAITAFVIWRVRDVVTVVLLALVGLVGEADQYYRERLPPSLRPSVDSWTENAGRFIGAAAQKTIGLTFHSIGFVVELILVPILVFCFLADGPGIR